MSSSAFFGEITLRQIDRAEGHDQRYQRDNCTHDLRHVDLPPERPHSGLIHRRCSLLDHRARVVGRLWRSVLSAYSAHRMSYRRFQIEQPSSAPVWPGRVLAPAPEQPAEQTTTKASATREAHGPPLQGDELVSGHERRIEPASAVASFSTWRQGRAAAGTVPMQPQALTRGVRPGGPSPRGARLQPGCNPSRRRTLT